MFRFPTPDSLVGMPNPRDGKPMMKSITRGLRTRRLPRARRIRDNLLGDVRRLQQRVAEGGSWNLEPALSLQETIATEERVALDPANVWSVNRRFSRSYRRMEFTSDGGAGREGGFGVSGPGRVGHPRVAAGVFGFMG